MLLDEPTNHLDLDALVWLEAWLARYPGTLMLISHDRDFLDNVCNRIVAFEGGTLSLYRGNYSAFERQRAEKLAGQQQAFQKQQQRIRRSRASSRAFAPRPPRRARRRAA
jgi:ATP-binding cassette subfamily F protein 3